MSVRNEPRKDFQSLPQNPRPLPPEAGPGFPCCESAALIVVDDPGCEMWPREVSLALTVLS